MIGGKRRSWQERSGGIPGCPRAAGGETSADGGLQMETLWRVGLGRLGIWHETVCIAAAGKAQAPGRRRLSSGFSDSRRMGGFARAMAE